MGVAVEITKMRESSRKMFPKELAESGYKAEIAIASGIDDFDRLLSELVRLSEGKGTNPRGTRRGRYLMRVIERVEEARALYIVYCT